MEIYNKSLPFSNAILKENISGGRILDVGGAACPLRANLFAEYCEHVSIVDPCVPDQRKSDKVNHIQAPIEEMTAEHGWL